MSQCEHFKSAMFFLKRHLQELKKRNRTWKEDLKEITKKGSFMYKVYINSLLQKLSNHCYAISINSLSLPAPSFADDVTLLALFPSFLKTFLNICHQYSVTWRYEFNHTKSGVVTFGETKPIHSRLMKERDWTLGDTKVDELYEYKNLGVLRNYAGSFTSNILDNIEKTRKKAGMIFPLISIVAKQNR